MENELVIIGLTGTNGSGKGLAASYFQSKGFDIVSLSDILREQIDKHHTNISREDLITCGRRIRELHGPDVLAKMAFARLRRSSVVDSIRHPSEVSFFRSISNFMLISIDAPSHMRYKRALERGRQESATTLDDFLFLEQLEMSGSENEQQLLSTMKLADCQVTNDSDVRTFFKYLESCLDTFFAEGQINE